jgi:hypothetical protein
MIRIVNTGRTYNPVTFCDHCGVRICDDHAALFFWQTGSLGDVTDGAIYHVHKRCNRAFEKARLDQCEMWMCDELRNLPQFITRNLDGCQHTSQTPCKSVLSCEFRRTARIAKPADQP